MNNFSFHNPTRLHFGQGQIAQIANEIPPSARVLLLYGGGSIKRNGVYDQVIAALAGRTVVEFAGVPANPEFDTLMQAVELGKKGKVDWVLGVGGGSVLDGSKFVAAALALDPEIDPWLIVGNKTPLKSALPIGCVLTLPATGSEANFAAVVTRRETQDKLSFKNPVVFPRFSVLDPSVITTLPPRQLGNGLVDAFVHTTEQYLTFPNEARVQDRLAEGILSTLVEIAPALLKDQSDYAAQANLMWAADQAMYGLVPLGQPLDWATHAIGHELTALYGLDHAQTLAITLPNLLEHTFETKQAKLAQYGRRVWGLSGDDTDVARAAIAATRDFFESVGVSTRLSGYGITDVAAAADGVRAQLIRHKRVALGEHGTLTPDDCHAIIMQAG
ncbi:iron-containing alcohol dehydrogenase [Jeongeupia naejangsanensis]|uniref:Iron-containing alcohol dehydrogenase n=1 Tax=Jeongeupia naejangsanensis TaxID=613195 RepID=A0ABS2BMA0_9NEIS|nr:iron-containing alcohol dehydrogenase [Jeongeupia naejangsanensis]MBM3116746.1 iron-containing alcohol dehydrogenase [Jeongeupia naejangsanensis]